MENIVKYFEKLLEIEMRLILLNNLPYWDLSHYNQFEGDFTNIENELKNQENKALSEISILNEEQTKGVLNRINIIDRDFDFVAKVDDIMGFQQFKHRNLKPFAVMFSNCTSYDNNWFEQNKDNISNTTRTFYSDFADFFLLKESSFYRIKEKIRQILKALNNEIDSISDVKMNSQPLIALKHYYLSVAYPHSEYEITKNNCNSIAAISDYESKYSGKKVLDLFNRFTQSKTDRLHGSKMVQNLTNLKETLKNYPEAIKLIEKDLTEIKNTKRKNNLVQ